MGGLTAFLPEAWRREHEARKAQDIGSPPVTLKTFLSFYDVPPLIDYLSLDIEGAEVPVLDEFFRHGPTCTFRLLTVEYREDAGELMRLHESWSPTATSSIRFRAWDAFFFYSRVFPWSLAMIAALELLLLFVALVAAVLLYRWLIDSAWFTRLVGGVVDAPARPTAKCLTAWIAPSKTPASGKPKSARKPPKRRPLPLPCGVAQRNPRNPFGDLSDDHDRSCRSHYRQSGGQSSGDP